MELQEHEIVLLQVDYAEFGLRSGDVGTVVHRPPEANVEAVMVEFTNADGRTNAVEFVLINHLRRLTANEIAERFPGHAQHDD